ncbi:MAG: FHA domain-containing protein [Planctomycetia bacterium]|nr:FHA domain-containing protein [Planctomycetia bacterium]
MAGGETPGSATSKPPAGSGGAPLRLVCQAGPEKGEEFPLNRMVLVIGRHSSCDVVMSETPISRQHARIEKRGDRWLLINLSQNGTRLNEKYVKQAPLSEGDVIQIGARTTLKVVAEEAAVAGAVKSTARRRKGLKELRAEEEAPPEPEEAPRDTIFKRRKLLIGLGVYFGIMVIVFIAVINLVSPDSSETAIEGLTVKKIEKIIGHKSRLARNPFMAEEMLQNGLKLYNQRTRNDDNLYKAVRAMQDSLAYDGRTFFKESEHRKIYQTAVKKLVERIWDTYCEGIWAEQADRKKEAAVHFRRLQSLVSDTDNRIYRIANQHLGRLSR